MRTSRIHAGSRWVALVVVASLLSVGPGAARGQAAPPPGPVVATPFGSAGFVAIPTWQPVDFAFFSNDLTSFDDFTGTVRAVFHEPEYLPDPFYGVKPGAPHSPPYNNEVSANVAAAGFAKKNVFDAG